MNSMTFKFFSPHLAGLWLWSFDVTEITIENISKSDIAYEVIEDLDGTRHKIKLIVKRVKRKLKKKLRK